MQTRKTEVWHTVDEVLQKKHDFLRVRCVWIPALDVPCVSHDGSHVSHIWCLYQFIAYCAGVGGGGMVVAVPKPPVHILYVLYNVDSCHFPGKTIVGDC